MDREITSQSIVQVLSGESEGSGVLISTPNGIRVLTCEHVIRDTKPGNIFIRARSFENNKWVFTDIEANILHVSKPRDLALLSIADTTKLRPLPISKNEPELYQDVSIIACHDGLFGCVFEGIVTGIKGSVGSDEYKHDLIISGYIVGGASGGAIVDEDGELVGILAACVRTKTEDLSHLTVATRLPAIRAIIKKDKALPSFTVDIPAVLNVFPNTLDTYEVKK